MGSGKTTVGQELADKLGCLHVDLDDYIEQQERLSILKIIHDLGIIYFRKVERKYLEQLLMLNDRMVLSLGGGTPCYYNNMELIKKSPRSSSFYLRATVPFLTERLYEEKSGRPLIADISTKPDLAEFIGKHVLERSGFYDQANHTIDIENKNPTTIAAEIAALG